MKRGKEKQEHDRSEVRSQVSISTSLLTISAKLLESAEEYFNTHLFTLTPHATTDIFTVLQLAEI